MEYVGFIIKGNGWTRRKSQGTDIPSSIINCCPEPPLMETQAIVELFPLFSVANPETLEWILSVIDEESYEQNEEII